MSRSHVEFMCHTIHWYFLRLMINSDWLLNSSKALVEGILTWSKSRSLVGSRSDGLVLYTLTNAKWTLWLRDTSLSVWEMGGTVGEWKHVVLGTDNLLPLRGNGLVRVH